MHVGTTRNGRTPHPLAVARKNRGLSLRALAVETDLTAVGISHIETGRSPRPRPLTKRVLAEALSYDVKDIWPPEGKKPHRDLRPGSNGRPPKKKKTRP
jgi:transcriptional regulator with XRE-family HTH domain